MKKIAILGAGFSGLAVCWHLSKNYQVDLFDPSGKGGEASNIAAGLLHKYAGPHAKLNRFGIEGEKASLELIKVAEEALSSSVIFSKGILRVALTEEKKQEYYARSLQHDDCLWNKEPPGLFIKDGLIVNCPKYLKGLWKACSDCTFFPHAINDLEQLAHYDAIVVATGANLLQFEELRHLRITQVKGQILEFAWPKDLPPLPVCLNAEAYITMMPGDKTCIAGATFEKEFASPKPDIAKAKELLMPKIKALIPPLENAEIISCRSGIRASTPDHLPIIGQFGNKLFAITGMGSKGLLYHALYAKKLCQQLLDFF